MSNTIGNDSISEIWNQLSASHKELQGNVDQLLTELGKDASKLDVVAQYQAANSALMNLFSAATSSMKSRSDKAEAISRNIT